jgi:hypothetical protein
MVLGYGTESGNKYGYSGYPSVLFTGMRRSVNQAFTHLGPVLGERGGTLADVGQYLTPPPRTWHR